MPIAGAAKGTRAGQPSSGRRGGFLFNRRVQIMTFSYDADFH
jgi:hypothetical protein